jgi:hypothetical protein
MSELIPMIVSTLVLETSRITLQRRSHLCSLHRRNFQVLCLYPANLQNRTYKTLDLSMVIGPIPLLLRCEVGVS